jgi:hypothetical protein
MEKQVEEAIPFFAGSKELEDFEFKRHDDFDVSKIVEYVREFESEWFIDTSRQELYPIHKHTNTYFVYSYDMDWKPGYVYKPELKCDKPELLELVNPIIKRLEEIHDGKVGRCLFIKLAAGKTIEPHSDGGEYLKIGRRHHIAIITNQKVGFQVGDTTIHMQPGECWEINNTRFHSVWNRGTEDRIHLLVDIIPTQWLKLND